MTALWGHVDDGMVRAFQAKCAECGWEGEMHFELDATAVMNAAADSRAHNVAIHDPEEAA